MRLRWLISRQAKVCAMGVALSSMAWIALRPALHTASLNLQLVAAVKRNDTSAVSSLLALGADPNARDSSRSFWQVMLNRLRSETTPMDQESSVLLIALYPRFDPLSRRTTIPPENVAMIHALLDHGADVNVQDQEGKTPLIYAVWTRKADTAEALMKRGADSNAYSEHKRTALMLAAAIGEVAMAERLLLHGAKINAQDQQGFTALRCAVLGEHRPMVRLLLQHGADPNLKDKIGDGIEICVPSRAWLRVALRQALQKQ